jgi:autotransporter-associated beta strand protein
MTKKAFFFCLYLCWTTICFFSKDLHATDYSWRGATSDITKADNWSPLGPPTLGDGGHFDDVGSDTPTLDASSTSALFQAKTLQFSSRSQKYTFKLDRLGGTIQISEGGIDALSSIVPQNFLIHQGSLFLQAGASSDLGACGLIYISIENPTSNAKIQFTDKETNAGKTNFSIVTKDGYAQSWLQFTSKADAKSSDIIVDANFSGLAPGALLSFEDSATANQATIQALNKGFVTFDSATAENAFINLNAGFLFIRNGATAENSTIEAKNGSEITLYNTTPSAGNATFRLDNSSITFNDTATGSTATINMDNSSTCSFHQSNQIGAINSDKTSLVVTNNALTIGATNADSDIEGNYLGSTNSTSITKSGTGILTLNGTNTYRGGTIINAGSVKVAADANLGSTSPMSNITIGALGTLEITNSFSTSRQISVAAGSKINVDPTTTFTVNAPIIGVGGSINKINSGTLILTAANTYSGNTRITGGILQGNSTSLQGAITNNASLIFNQTTTGTYSNQISGSGAVFKQNSGTLNLSNTNTYSGGTTVLGGILALTGGTGALLSASNLTLSGGATLDLSAGAVFPVLGDLSSSDGTTTLALGSQTLTAGTATPMTTFAGIISGVGGQLIKVGSGTLILTGANTYSGGTEIDLGTLQGNSISIQGNVINNTTLVFDQQVNGSCSASISGPGTLIKQGASSLTLTHANDLLTGDVLVESGSLIVNNLLGNGLGNLHVSPTAFLKGNGTISKNVTIDGSIAPGNSFGTLTINGDFTFDTGSLYYDEIDPLSSDLLNVNGHLIINPGATIFVLPEPGVYSFPKNYLIATYNTRTGEFRNVVINPLLFLGYLEYSPHQLLLHVIAQEFFALFNSGNAGAVAHCLDALQSSADNDLSYVINSIRLLETMKEIEEALLQLQPSQFTALSIAQENNALYARTTLQHRMEDKRLNCHSKSDKQLSFWTSPLFAKTKQKKEGNESAYHVTSEGLFTGCDICLPQSFMIGGGVGYVHDNLHWFSRRGKASTHNIYLAAFGQWEQTSVYAQGGIIGGYNYYKTTRHIEFGELLTINRHTKGTHQGVEASGYVQIGLKTSVQALSLSPFLSCDFIYLYEGSFKEKGANSIDLKVDAKHSDLFVGQAGIDFWYCSSAKKYRFVPHLQLSVLREERFLGRHENACFSYSCPMNIVGYYPSRTLGSVFFGFNRPFSYGEASVSFQGKYGKKYSDNSLWMELSFSW